MTIAMLQILENAKVFKEIASFLDTRRRVFLLAQLNRECALQYKSQFDANDTSRFLTTTKLIFSSMQMLVWGIDCGYMMRVHEPKTYLPIVRAKNAQVISYWLARSDLICDINNNISDSELLDKMYYSAQKSAFFAN